MSADIATASGPSAGPSGSGKDLQIPINLFTRNPTHTIPSSTYLLPSSWRRYHLSSLLNTVLSPDSPIPFDFIIDGHVLRGSLEAYVKEFRGGDVESRLEVEYVESLMPPKEVGKFPQEDWVSGVSLGRPGYILLSSYLSHLKLIPLSTNPSPSSSTFTDPPQTLTIPLPSPLGATSCAYLSSPTPSTSTSSSTSNNILLGAGGMDRKAHIFSVPSHLLDPTLDQMDTDSPTNNQVKEILTLHGHTGPISSIKASPSYDQVLTSSWDGTLSIYSLPTASNPYENFISEGHQLDAEANTYLPGQKRANKKRRLNNTSLTTNGEEVQADSLGDKITGEGMGTGMSTREGGLRRRPDLVLRGHEGRVGGGIWDNGSGGSGGVGVWSVGWDGSVRGWDAEYGRGVVTKQGPRERAGLCIDQMNGGSGALVTGHMERVVCLWDVRESTSLISLTLPTPSSTPSLSTHPTSPFTLSTASYSGVLQIWDIRSPKQAIFTVRKSGKSAPGKSGRGGKVLDGERVLALDWDGERMVAGGEDGEVAVWDARGQ